MAKSAQIAKLKDWHNQLIDYCILNPDKKNYEVAKEFKVAPAWLSVVRNSDAFQLAYGKRLAEHRCYLSATVIQKLEAVADLSLDHLLRILEEQGDILPPSFIKETVDMALKRCGFGSPTAVFPSPGDSDGLPSTQVHLHITSEILESAREKIRSYNTREPIVIEHEKTQVGDASS